MNTLALILFFLVILSYVLRQQLTNPHAKFASYEVRAQVVFAHALMWYPVWYVCGLAADQATSPPVTYGWLSMRWVMIIYCLYMIGRKTIFAR